MYNRTGSAKTCEGLRATPTKNPSRRTNKETRATCQIRSSNSPSATACSAAPINHSRGRVSSLPSENGTTTLLMTEDVSGVLFRHPLLARPPAGADARTNAEREGAAGGDEAVEAGGLLLSREVAGLARLPPAQARR
jgi:hypothetical protein